MYNTTSTTEIYTLSLHDALPILPRRRRERWRRTKSRRKLERPAKDSERKTIEGDESVHGEQSDRLLASALKYWEVERDLIEERLAAIRRATAASWNFTPRGR